MKKSKFFSFALMREGIKQTMGVGICLMLVSMFVSAYLPFVIMFQGYSDYITVPFGNFFAPIFLMGYITPMIFIFALFGFMNKRNSSDFYHSIPLNRSCVYITYTVTAMLWCTFITTVSTLFSYGMYVMNPKITILPSFIGNTIGTTFVLMLLIAAIALVAKGLSGTTFSNVAIMFLLMFVPRIIISLLTSAVQLAAPVLQTGSIPIVDIGCNIIFLPLLWFVEGAYSWKIDSTTIWYSLILAVVYLVGGFFIHKVRKSETAETGSSFKWVQHVVRSLIGIVPTFLITYPLAARIEKLPTETIITAIIVSLLAYFLYELATTRSAKKLLFSIPLYLVVVVFGFAFVFGSHAISNSIVNYVPTSSEVKSVSVKYSYYSNYDKQQDAMPYNAYTLEDCEYDDKEMIDILCSSLADDVKYIQEGTFNKYKHEGYSNSQKTTVYGVQSYDVTFHCKDGNNVQRTVYILNMDYYFTEQNGRQSNQLEKLLKDSDNYTNAITKLPDDKEINQIELSGYFYDMVGGNLSQDELKELWKTYKEEYNALPTVAKKIMNLDYYDYYDVFHISVYGYVGTNNFYAQYHINANNTPKTLQKLSDIYSNKNDHSSQTLEKVLSGIDVKKNFTVSMKNIIGDGSDELRIENNNYHNNERCINMIIPNNQYISDVYEGNQPANYTKFSDEYQIDDVDFDNIKKAVKILTDAAQRECNFADKRMFILEIYTEYNSYENKNEQEKMMYSEGETNNYIINLTADEYKELYDTLKKAVHTNQ